MMFAADIVIDTASALVDALSRSLATGSDLLEALLPAADRRLLVAAAQPRRFSREAFDRLVAPAALAAAGAGAAAPAEGAFERLSTLRVIQPLPGRSGWFAVEPTRRERLLKVPPGDEAATLGVDPEPWRDLHGNLAAWFDGLGSDGELEALYHRLTLGEPAAHERWQASYTEARDRFDLARCESLLELLAQRMRYLPPQLSSTVTRERALLAARSAFAEDYFRTSRYIERDQLPFAFGNERVRLSLLQGFERLLQDEERFILQLHAPGGSGKTMFLRWLAARWCLPRDIPVARVDFDFLDDAEHSLASVFMLGKFVERLDPQLPGRPFFELLGNIAEERRRLAGPGHDQALDPAGEALENRLAKLEEEVRERMARTLVELCPGKPVVLVLDTLEEAALRHQVDLLALVKTVAGLRERLRSLASTPQAAPRLVLIVSGRYTLVEQFDQVHAAFEQRLAECEVAPFTEAESLVYLNRRLTGIDRAPAPEVIAAVVQRSRGSPFKLSLYADVLLATPGLGLHELGQGVDVDTLYLIERVLKRIGDPALRWLLRYGVLARRLTRGFVEQVLLRALRRALRGDTALDNPAEDGVAHKDWPRLWVSGAAPTDAATLWRRLREYASASSWINMEPSADDAVVIQPVVKHPMRRALLHRDRPVVEQIHRAAIARARLVARDGDDPVQQGEALAELSFHDFLLHGPQAAQAWWRRLREHQYEPDVAIPLASVVLSDDLRESEIRGAATGEALVTPATAARAHFVLAGQYLRLSRIAEQAAPKAQELARARASLATFDLLVQQGAAAREVAVPLCEEGQLRLDLAGGPEQVDAGLAQLEASLATRLSAEQRSAVLLSLSRAYARRDDDRARHFSRLWGQQALRLGDPESYAEWVSDEISESLEGLAPRRAILQWHAAAERLKPTGARWRSAADARETRRELVRDEPRLLAAAALPAAALRRFQSLYPESRLPGQLFAKVSPRSKAVSGQAPLDAEIAEILLETGQPAAARDRAAALLAALAGATRTEPEREGLVQRWTHRLRTRALMVQSHAARVLMEHGAALDAVSQAISVQAESGDHFNEVLSRLHMARLTLFDIGNLRQAAELVQDDDDAFADTEEELRIEHMLLRAALRGQEGDAARQAELIGRARQLLDKVAPQRCRVRLHVALAGMGCHGLDRAAHAEALAEALGRYDHVALRLAPVGELRYIEPIEGLPGPLVARLERLSRVEGLRLPGHLRLQPLDRIKITLTRAELLRVLGQGERAADELRSLASPVANQEPGAWWRQLALACDRLQMDPAEVLPPDWLGAAVKHLRRERRFCAVIQAEAAERAATARDTRAAARLLKNAGRQILRDPGVAARWQLRALTLHTRLARAHPDQFGDTDARALQASLQRVSERLGVQMPASPTPPKPLDSLAGLDQVEGLHINAAGRVQHLAHRYDGPNAVRGSILPAAPFDQMLKEFASGQFSGGASLQLAAQLGQIGSWFGISLARGALPASLLKPLQQEPQAAEPFELMIEHEVTGMHAMPWELMIPGPGPFPISLHPGVMEVWRTRPGAGLRGRVAAAQRALTRLGVAQLTADGALGLQTRQALAAWERGSTARGATIDARVLRALQREATELAGNRPVPTVLLIQPTREAETASQRGLSISGQDVEELYRQAGIHVAVLDEPDVDRLHKVFQLVAPAVLHITNPIAQSRSSRELSLQFAARHELSHTTALGPRLLGRVLQSAPLERRPSLIVVETPRPSSRDETVRQLLCRNAFAAQLFEQAEGPPVVAMGLAPPDQQYRCAQVLLEAARDWHAPAQMVGELRRIGVNALNESVGEPDLIDLLPSAGVALFAHEPLMSGLLSRAS